MKRTALLCAWLGACGGAAQPPAAEPSAPVAAAPARAASPTRAQLQAWADAGVGALLAHVEATPVLREGKLLGYRLRGLEGPEVLARVGLRDGDVLLRAADITLITPGDAAAALQAARDAESLRFSVLRGGEPLEISVEIVEEP